MSATIPADVILRHHLGLGLDPKVREAITFVLAWAGVLLLAIATEVGGLYLLDALR